ncbi:MAG: type ISP restriction/modification enzyme, partial [Chromatiaceae bacterium]
GRDLFIVDNSVAGWTGIRYLQEWCGIAKAFVIATGYFEIGALLALDQHFHIGGYQVCEKWLKYRKGRTLSDDDIAHYHKIVVALNETIRLMQEIDAVIDQHGGWPGAFVLNSGEQA